MLVTLVPGHIGLRLWWCAFLVSFAYNFKGSLGEGVFTTKPVNMVGMKGSPMQLNCAAKDTRSGISWYDYTHGIKEVSLNSENYFKKMYTIGGIPPIYNLQIHKLKMTSGGQYACSASGQAFGVAEVIVLDGSPACWTNVSADGISVAGDLVELTCSVRYSASSELWAPTIRWSPPPGGGKLADNYTYSDYQRPTATYNSSIVVEVTPALDGAMFNSDIRFQAPVNQEPGRAINDPSYSNAWYSKPLNVQFPPQNIEVCPDEHSYLPGSKILCFATSKPLSAYNWVDLSSNQTYSSAYLTVPEYTEEEENKYRFKCIASNTIRGVKYLGESKIVRFEVVSNDRPQDRRILILGGVIAVLAVLLLFIIAAFIGYCRRRNRPTTQAYHY